MLYLYLIQLRGFTSIVARSISVLVKRCNPSVQAAVSRNKDLNLTSTPTQDFLRYLPMKPIDLFTSTADLCFQQALERDGGNRTR